MAKRESPVETEKGSKKYKEMIHNQSKLSDQKNLPFTFPKKKKLGGGRRVTYECPDCGNLLPGSSYTCMIVCRSCDKLVTVREGRFGDTYDK